MPRPVILLTSGTRGDVLPYAALARALIERGQPAEVAAHAAFLPLLAAQGAPARLLSANPNDLMNQPGAFPLTFNGSLRQSFHALRNYLRQVRPVYRAMLASAWEACQGAAAVIVGLPTLWGLSIAEALGKPGLACPLQPLTRTGEFPSALQPFTGSLGRGYNRLTHRLAEQMLWQAWRAEINDWRANLLRLPPLPFFGPYAQLYARQVPFIYGISEHVLPRPADWPAAHTLTGYWFAGAPAGWQPPEALLRFLEAGDPPLYIGFGSMQQPDRLLPALRAALQVSGVRAVVALGEERRAELPANALAVGDLPHAWLFPRLSAALHHGGAGTTAASMRAGLPTAIAPVGVDQFFWGGRVAELGVGPPPLPQRRLTAGGIATLLELLTRDVELRRRAAGLGAAIRSEDGLSCAADQIIPLVRRTL